MFYPIKRKNDIPSLSVPHLSQGSVPELDEWTGKNAELIRFIHSELRDAFECIKTLQQPETRKKFFSSSRMCFLIPKKWIVKRTFQCKLHQ